MIIFKMWAAYQINKVSLENQRLEIWHNSVTGGYNELRALLVSVGFARGNAAVTPEIIDQ